MDVLAAERGLCSCQGRTWLCLASGEPKLMILFMEQKRLWFHQTDNDKLLVLMDLSDLL